MAVELGKEGWLPVYREMRSPMGFLSAMFTYKAGGMYNGRKVAIDVQRFGEQISIGVRKRTGPRLNDFKDFTTKEFVPPSYGEAFPIDADELLDRLAGADPYTAAYTEYAAQLVSMMALGFRLVGDMIDRSVELQASQILQTGLLSLTDASGNVTYDITFFPKATHFPTASISWATAATATPIDDLQALATIIRADGKVNPDKLIFGGAAMTNFMRTDQVTEALDNRRIEIGGIAPSSADDGSTFYGMIWIGAYRFEMWIYPETYEDPQTSVSTTYVGEDNVIMLSTRTRLDKTSAKVSLPVGPDPRVAGLVPGRLSDSSQAIDVTPNVYVSENNKQIMGELESCPLLVPVQIDGFGCLDTTP